MNTFVKIGENFASFWNLLVLSKNNLFNSAVYKKQNRKLRKLMKRAYEIPFYRKKFDVAGLKPKDIKNREDLVKFPILTKNEIKEWLTPLVDSEKERMHIVSTSGSTGTPLKTNDSFSKRKCIFDSKLAENRSEKWSQSFYR